MGDVAKRIRHRRIELGLSVTEAARRAEISRAYVHKIEGAEADVTISRQVLFRLSRALDTTPAQLLGVDPDDAPLPMPPEVLPYVGAPTAVPGLLPAVVFATLKGKDGRQLSRNDFIAVAQALVAESYGVANSREGRRAARLLAEAMVDGVILEDDRERDERIAQKLRRLASTARSAMGTTPVPRTEGSADENGEPLE